MMGAMALGKACLRMTSKAVIGEDSSEVRIAVEKDAVKVEHFAFEPACDWIDAGDGRHRIFLVGGNPDSEPMVLRH